MACQVSASSWAQLMRMMSMPATRSRCTRSGSVAASLGMVTMMRVLRLPPPAPDPSRVRLCSFRYRPPVLIFTEPWAPCPLWGSPARARRASSTASMLLRTWASTRPRRLSPKQGQILLQVAQVALAQGQVVQQVAGAVLVSGLDLVYLGPVGLGKGQDLLAQGFQGGNESISDIGDGQVHAVLGPVLWSKDEGSGLG